MRNIDSLTNEETALRKRHSEQTIKGQWGRAQTTREKLIRNLNQQKRVKCRTCHGTGRAYLGPGPSVYCPDCTPNVPIQLPHYVAQEDNAVCCPKCGSGYAERVDCTEAEITSNLNCGRNYECCCRAFVCKSCGVRIVAQAAAPEME